MKKVTKMMLQAVARGWCYKETGKKVMDADLARAITKEMVTGQDAVANALLVLGNALKKDDDFFQAYKANIAMAFKDEYHRHKTRKKSSTGQTHINSGDVHHIANTAAVYFLNLLFGLKK